MKDGAKNRLREQDIKRIVDAWESQKDIPHYCRIVEWSEIESEKNDYNLNIPRYVDTFEEEEEIDIKAVMAEIKSLEAKRADLDAQIDVYLKELGIID